MGLTPRKPTEANLQDDVAMDAALAAAAHLNSVSKGGKKKKKKDKRRKGRRSSIALMRQTEDMFADDSEGTAGGPDDGPPALLSDWEMPAKGPTPMPAPAAADLHADDDDEKKAGPEEGKAADAEPLVEGPAQTPAIAGPAPPKPPLSEIKTPNRTPEVPSAADKAFIQPDDESISFDEDADDEDDETFEPTDSELESPPRKNKKKKKKRKAEATDQEKLAEARAQLAAYRERLRRTQ